MKGMISNLCNALSSSGENDLQEVLLNIAFVFENYMGSTNDAWSDEIKSMSVSKEEALYLKKYLVSFIKSKPNNLLLGASIWAFGKIADKNDKNFLDEILSQNIEGDSGVLFQIMYVLNNIGIKLFDSDNKSMFDVEQNIRCAKLYLHNPDKMHTL